MEKGLSRDELDIQHPSAPFVCGVAGDWMMNTGYVAGDSLIFEKARAPTHSIPIVAPLAGNAAASDTFSARL